MSKRRLEEDNSNLEQKKKSPRGQETAPEVEEKYGTTIAELKLAEEQKAYYRLLLDNISTMNLTDLREAIPDATTLNKIERGQSNFLCAAAQHNREDIVEYLLEVCQADPTVPDSQERIPVIVAANNDNADILGLMYERVEANYFAFQDTIDDTIAEDIAEALVSALLRGNRRIANFLLAWSSPQHIVNLLKDKGSNVQMTTNLARALFTAWPLLCKLIIEKNGLADQDDKPAETTESATASTSSSSSSMYQQPPTSSSASVTTSGLFRQLPQSSSSSSESASSETTSSTPSTS